ncbi:lysophospholipid acyltransferase family protein [Butyricimonas synergistica]|uniref:lysophospholipid acyltransferase family protein n=1 Tax=Butyricimonas synergistica TaxID=544644 RepID=UPI000370FFE5|nr:lysophospholipid acyltransferase family protein [Butyricimonas synergistica]
MFSYILYVFIWLISFLPFRMLYVVADMNYVLLYYVFRYRRRVVRVNLCNSFPEKSLKEIVGIERKYYKHMADLTVELYKLWHMSEASIRKRCVFRNTELPQKYFDEGRSVIGVLGHYGNWEWMSSYSLWENDADFLALYKPIRDKMTDRMMKEIRSRFGAVLVAKDDTLRVIARYRSEGRLFLAGFIGDQTPNVHNLNFWTRFLNQDTPVLLGTERIARKYDIPVVSVRMRKVKRGYYEVEFVDVCPHPAELEPGVLTEKHTRLLESFIREEPQYWLWSHKRWKHRREN